MLTKKTIQSIIGKDECFKGNDESQIIYASLPPTSPLQEQYFQNLQ